MTSACFDQSSEVRSNEPTYCLVRWVFLRLIGLIYLVAFVSLAVELPGLIGSKGILPADDYLNAISASTPDASRFFLEPTVAWLNTSDAFLQALCFIGGFAALGVALAVCAGPLLVVAWAIYLSLMNIGQDFLSFQWDILLLETGFLAMLWAPWKLLEAPWKSRLALTALSMPARIMLILLRWLLFKLMFLSGAVKLLSGDETWRSLTALRYHYYTQPLPTPLAWLAQQLPDCFQTISVFIMFVIELCVPFLFFLPRPFRLVGAALTAALQVLILLTGNYTFFNLLTLALCVTLLDDQLLMRILPPRITQSIVGHHPEVSLEPAGTSGGQGFLKPMASGLRVMVVIVAVVFHVSSALYSFRSPASALVRPILALISPFHIVNGYGLFAVMTTSRPEIIIEGSNDGESWRAYTFKYKPGPLNRPPPIIAPLQPRLDWQMWFAALAGAGDSPWFFKFVRRLLEGSPNVVRLLERDPFSGGRPKYIRATLYDYKFTNWEELQNTGNWWKRTESGRFLPPVSLENFQF